MLSLGVHPSRANAHRLNRPVSIKRFGRVDLALGETGKVVVFVGMSFRFWAHPDRVKVRANAVFEGRVQGVFFRASTKECADSLGLTGWVRNMPDGRVEAVFEGEENKVRRALDLCSANRAAIRVDSKIVKMSDATGEFEGFVIRHE
jgi:acylphosphatase